MEKHLREQEQEKAHLAQCLEIIQENIRLYEDKESRYKKEVTELFQAVKKEKVIPMVVDCRKKYSGTYTEFPS